MARHCDVAIVGGGPAGSTCARLLVSAGLDVVVLDKEAFPRDKVCAGWITPEVIDATEMDLADYATGRTLQPILGFETGVVGGRRVTSTYDRPVSYAIRRCEFDTYLLRRSGADSVEGTRVTHLERKSGGWVVNGIIEARMLVGAGGHFCPVARHLNPHEGDLPTLVAAQEIEVRLDGPEGSAVSPTVPELYFCHDLRGYGWCVRKGDYLNVGFGRQDRRALPEASRAFLATLQQLGRVPAGFPSCWHGHAYCVYGLPVRRVLGEGVLLAGDAAGLAFPTSGEGIYTAVESGRIAARAILRAAPTFTQGRLAPYETALVRRFGRPGPTGPASWPVSPSVFAAIGRQLMAVPWFARHVLLDRSFLHRRGAAAAASGAPRP